MEKLLAESDWFDTDIAIDHSLWWNNAKLLDGVADQLRVRPRLEKILYFGGSDEKGIVNTERPGRGY